jgi:hypothetical protein
MIFLNEKEHDGANPLKLLEFAVGKWPQYFEPWLAATRKLGQAQLGGLVDQVPRETIPSESRAFVEDLLAFTLSRIQSVEK